MGKIAFSEKGENQKDERELPKLLMGMGRERGKENNGMGEDEKKKREGGNRVKKKLEFSWGKKERE